MFFKHFPPFLNLILFQLVLIPFGIPGVVSPLAMSLADDFSHAVLSRRFLNFGNWQRHEPGIGRSRAYNSRSSSRASWAERTAMDARHAADHFSACGQTVANLNP